MTRLIWLKSGKKSKYLHFEQLNLDKIYTKKYGEYQMFLDIVAKLELKL